MSESSQSEEWRDFEQLVARLEHVFAPQGAVVKSPDTLADLTTGEMREVDATIKYRLGTQDILVVFECRRRSRVEDVTWIEQLATKTTAVGASKCVAVSSTGFSEGAKKKAARHAIELRTVSELAANEFADVVKTRGWVYKVRILQTDPSYSKQGEVELNHALDRKINGYLGKKYSIEHKILRRKGSQRKISWVTYLHQILNRAYLEASSVEQFKFKINEEFIMSFAGDPEYFVIYKNRKYDVIGCAYKIIFSEIHDFTMAPPTIIEYSGNDGNWAGIELSLTGKSQPWSRIGLYADPDLSALRVASWDREGQLMSNRSLEEIKAEQLLRAKRRNDRAPIIMRRIMGK